MKVIFVLFLVAIASARAFSVEPQEFIDVKPVIPGFNPNARITNGKPASITNFPFQVGLYANGGWCGGSLISNTWVLTAAHCVHNVDVGNMKVYLGSTRRLEGICRIPKFKIMHSEYNAKDLTNDIAVLKIDAVRYSRYIRNSILPAIGANSSYEGNTVIASGWGRTTDANYDNSDILQYAELKVVPVSVCFNAYGSMAKPANICVATPGGTSTCNGDSGGPLILKSSKVQIGLTSFGSTISCTSEYPSGFTRITSYRQWIRDNTGV